MHRKDNVFFRYVQQKQKKEHRSYPETKILQKKMELKDFFSNIDHGEQER